MRTRVRRYGPILILMALLGPFLAFPGASSQEETDKLDGPLPASQTIDLGGAEVIVPADEPVVHCVVGEYADLTRTTLMVDIYVLDLDGYYRWVGKFATQQTGPFADASLLDCLFVERGP